MDEPSRKWSRRKAGNAALEAGRRRVDKVEQGWVGAIRTMHPDAPMYTFWDYKRNRWERDAGLRIDHLLLNTKAAKRLIEAGVDREVRGRDNARKSLGTVEYRLCRLPKEAQSAGRL
jgi:exodeoxyribonuclease-3